MRKIYQHFIGMGVLVGLGLPCLLYLANGFFKILGMAYHQSEIGSFFVMCICLLSYGATAISRERPLLFLTKGSLVGNLLNILAESFLMTVYLLGSTYLYLKLVPDIKFSDLSLYIWPLIYIWFFLLISVIFFVKYFLSTYSTDRKNG